MVKSHISLDGQLIALWAVLLSSILGFPEASAIVGGVALISLFSGDDEGTP